MSRGRLVGCGFDGATLRHVQDVAQTWRRTGLLVDVTDLMPSPPGGAHGYVLTARSATTVMVLRCEVWRQRRLLRAGRKLWTMRISVRQRDEAGDAIREIGAVAALDQAELWEQIEAWIDGRLRPAGSLEEAVSELT